MQKWEYKVIHRLLGWERKGKLTVPTAWDVDIMALLPSLGEEGWELVSAWPRSTATGDAWAGVTTGEMWVFKRPKSGGAKA